MELRVNDCLKVGDYVEYLPDRGNYKIPQSIAGVEYTQTLETDINGVWRVLGKNTYGVLVVGFIERCRQINVSYKKGTYDIVRKINYACRSCYSNKELGIVARNMALRDLRLFKVKTLTKNKLGVYLINSEDIVKEMLLGDTELYEVHSQSSELVREDDITWCSVKPIRCIADVGVMRSKLIVIDEKLIVNGDKSFFSFFSCSEPRRISKGDEYALEDDVEIREQASRKDSRFAIQIRPVITFGDNVVVTGGDGSKENPWRITREANNFSENSELSL